MLNFYLLFKQDDQGRPKSITSRLTWRSTGITRLSSLRNCPLIVPIKTSDLVFWVFASKLTSPRFGCDCWSLVQWFHQEKSSAIYSFWTCGKHIFFLFFFFSTTLMSVDILDISPIPVILLILKVEGTQFSERETLFNLQEFNSFHVSN